MAKNYYTTKYGDTKGTLKLKYGVPLNWSGYKKKNIDDLQVNEKIDLNQFQNTGKTITKPKAYNVDNVTKETEPINVIPTEPPINNINTSFVNIPSPIQNQQPQQPQIDPFTQQRTKLEQEASVLNQQIAGLSENKYAFSADQRADQQRLLEMKTKLSGVKDRLFELQDKQVTIPQEQREIFQKAGALVTDTQFAQTTQPDLIRNQEEQLAKSREYSRLGSAVSDYAGAVQMNQEHIDNLFNAKKEKLEFDITEKNNLINSIITQQGSILTEKLKFDLEDRKHQNNLEINEKQSELDFRKNIATEMIKKGVSGNDLNTVMNGNFADIAKIKLDTNSNLTAKQILENNVAQRTINNRTVMLARDMGEGASKIDEFDALMLQGTDGNNGIWVISSAGGLDALNKKRGALSADKRQSVTSAIGFMGTLLSQQTLDGLRDAADKGIKFGALSEKELQTVANSTTALAQWAIYEKNPETGETTNKLIGFNATPEQVNSEIKKIRLSYMRSFVENANDDNYELKTNLQFWNEDDIRETYIDLRQRAKEGSLFNNTTDSTSSIANFIQQEEVGKTGNAQLTAYPDGKGYSIGYGMQTFEGKPVTKNMQITKQQADKEFGRQLPNYMTWADKINVPVDLNTATALTSFEYNLGSGIWDKDAKPLLEDIISGNKVGAAEKLNKFIYGRLGANQPKEKLQALVNRRKREASLLLA